MTAQRVVQLMDGFAEGDAISGEALALQDVFTELGYESALFAVPSHISPQARDACQPLTAYVPSPDDLVIYHYAIASPVADVYRAAAGRKILVYHNITPASFFEGFDDGLAARLRDARTQLTAVAGASDALWADSQFNADELAELGCGSAEVFPLLFSPTRFERAADPAIAARYQKRLTSFLFVGRIAPNKAVEDLILAFAWYHGKIDPWSRLSIVGSPDGCPRYYTMLRMLAGELELANVCFEGYATPEGLCAHYEGADLFVSASQHEGYCLPLVEAMFKGVPVVARSTGGTPEAMGGGGVLYDEAEPVELAELWRRVVSDQALRAEVLASQRQRVTALRERRPVEELRTLLAKLPPK